MGGLCVRREGMQLLFLTNTIYLLDLASVWGQVVTVPYLYLLDFKSVGRQSYNISTRSYICMGGSEPFFSFRWAAAISSFFFFNSFCWCSFFFCKSLTFCASFCISFCNSYHKFLKNSYPWKCVLFGEDRRVKHRGDHSVVTIQFNSIQFIDQLRALKGQQENCT